MTTPADSKKHDLLQSIEKRDLQRKAKLFNKTQISIYDQIMKQINLITSLNDLKNIEIELKERQKDLGNGEFHNLTARLEKFRERHARMEKAKANDTRVKFRFSMKKKLMEEIKQLKKKKKMLRSLKILLLILMK